VKRILILFCALFLMLDMADDGCLGKAQFDVPLGQGTYSFTCSPDGSGNLDTQVGLPLTNFLAIPQRFPNLPLLLEVDRAISLIDFYFSSSSGGLPL
jgi:hypothetical protein